MHKTIITNTINNFLYAGSFDSVVSTELQNAGKAGLVTLQGKIYVPSYYICL